MPAAPSPRRLAVSSLLLATATALPAQGGGLSPGTFVGTTFGIIVPGPSRVTAGDAVLSIDTFAGTATQLAITGFPSVTGEFPWGVHIENRHSFLLGSANLAGFSFTQGSVYRVAQQGGAWTATQLNTNLIGEAVWSIAEIGGTVYFTATPQFSNGSVPMSKVWSVSRWGGTASVFADLTSAGAQGAGGAMVALGSTLHVFTFRSIAGLSGEHWVISTIGASPVPQLVGDLPLSIRLGFSLGRGFGPLQAKWDARESAFVIAGVYGDVLWRDPNGNDLRHWAPSTVINYATMSDEIGALAIDTDTGAVILGDRRAHIEQLRSPRGSFLEDHLTLPLVPQAWVASLDYLPTTARYVPDGPIGCPQQSGQWPVSYIDSRPTPGNAGFALTLETSATAGFLVLGLDNAIWGSNLLPYSLSSWGAPGCVVGTSVDAVVPFVGPDPIVPAPLPNGAFTAWTQWAALDPANPLGLVLSDARRMEVR